MRYRVEKRNSGFWPYAVLCGTGTQELFIGHKKQCLNVAAKLEQAFNVGQFVADELARGAFEWAVSEWDGQAIDANGRACGDIGGRIRVMWNKYVNSHHEQIP